MHICSIYVIKHMQIWDTKKGCLGIMNFSPPPGRFVGYLKEFSCWNSLREYRQEHRVAREIVNKNKS